MMKVLFANKYFYRRGGAEASMFETMDLLRSRGHECVVFSMRHPENDACENENYFVSQMDLNNLPSLLDKIRAACRIVYSIEARQKIRRLILDTRPDIAHLNNIYHQLSPSIIDELKLHGIPVVMTARDYKLVCPVYSMNRNGRLCEECRNRRFVNCVRYRCYNGHLVNSATLALEMYIHHGLLRIYDKLDKVIVASDFVERKMREMGFGGDLEVIPNFIDHSRIDPRFEPDLTRRSIVYFGMVAKVKGVWTLLRAMEGLDVHLDVVGEGDALDEIRRYAGERSLDVTFHGRLNKRDLEKVVGSSLFTVFPSEWPEPFGRVVIESYALGKPVVASRIGAIPELVRENESGLTFTPGDPDDLREKIRRLLANPEKIARFGKTGRSIVEREYGPGRHYERLIGVYQRLLDQAPRDRRISSHFSTFSSIV